MGMRRRRGRNPASRSIPPRHYVTSLSVVCWLAPNSESKLNCLDELLQVRVRLGQVCYLLGLLGGSKPDAGPDHTPNSLQVPAWLYVGEAEGSPATEADAPPHAVTASASTISGKYLISSPLVVPPGPCHRAPG